MEPSAYTALRLKIIAAILVLSLTPLFSLGYVIHTSFSQAYKEKVERALRIIMEDKRNAIDMFLEASLAQLRTGLVEQKGDQATVRVQYPLAGKELDLEVQLQRREGHWYLARTLTEVEALLSSARAAEQARAEAATPPVEDAPDNAGPPAGP